MKVTIGASADAALTVNTNKANNAWFTTAKLSNASRAGFCRFCASHDKDKMI